MISKAHHNSWLRRQRQERDKVRFEAYQEWQRTEEITDQSERLAAPMENQFEYSLGNDGHLYSEYGDMLLEVLQGGLVNAEAAARLQPDVGFEVERRNHELDELLAVEALAGSPDNTPTSVVILSPIPDAVRNKTTAIRGYDSKRQKLMVRIWERSSQGVSSLSMSLDKSDHKAIQAAVSSLGYDLADDTTGSEEILAMRFFSNTPLKELRDNVRTAYDDSLASTNGGKWFAGRQFDSVLNARTFINTQPDLISSHMQAVAHIQSLGLGLEDKNELLEEARFGLAAALDDRLHSRLVASIADSSALASAEGRSFDRECPTFTASTRDQLGALGFQADVWRQGTCRVCLAGGSVGSCSVCKSCESADNHGDRNALARIHQLAVKRRQLLAKTAMRKSALKTNELKNKPTELRARRGVKLRQVEKIVIGGTKKVWLNEQGEELE